MHIVYVYEKVKIWSNYIFPFKYKENDLKAVRSVQLLNKP